MSSNARLFQMSNVSQDVLQWCNFLFLYEAFDVNEMGEKKDVFTQGIACSFISILPKVLDDTHVNFFVKHELKGVLRCMSRKDKYR